MASPTEIVKDARWMLASSAPLRCTSPADVYLLLKSSDFTMHDLDENCIFQGCVDRVHTEDGQPTNGSRNGVINGFTADSSSITSSLSEKDNSVQLELVLKKWYEIERSREVRCFIRNNRLLGEQFAHSTYTHLFTATPSQLSANGIQIFLNTSFLKKFRTEFAQRFFRFGKAKYGPSLQTARLQIVSLRHSLHITKL